MTTVPVHHIVCSCHSTEHLVQFVADDPDDEEAVCYVEVQLIQYRSFFQRAKVALRYLFGYQCRYGHWDCTSLDQEEAQKLYDFLKTHTRVGKKDLKNQRIAGLEAPMRCSIAELEAAREEYPAGVRTPDGTLVPSRVLEP
jgi:hypothetical protein